jgi:hypothetical protein
MGSLDEAACRMRRGAATMGVAIRIATSGVRSRMGAALLGLAYVSVIPECGALRSALRFDKRIVAGSTCPDAVKETLRCERRTPVC